MTYSVNDLVQTLGDVSMMNDKALLPTLGK